MRFTKEGIRVGAILGGSKETKIVKFLGYGKYVGDHPPVEAVGWMAESLAKSNVPNPKIELDNGEVVYGCECWWGVEAGVKEKLAKYTEAGYEVVEVKMSDVREDFRKESEAEENNS